jgi:hypothetical protein
VGRSYAAPAPVPSWFDWLLPQHSSCPRRTMQVCRAPAASVSIELGSTH